MVAACAVLLVAPFTVLAVTAASAGASYTGCSASVSSTTLVLGQSASVAAEGNCFQPNDPVTVTIRCPGSAAVVVATGTSAADGSFAASFVVPATLPVGQCTITLSGTNVLGKPQVLSIPVTLVAVSASSASKASSSGGGLAFTGQDSGTVLGIAAALMALGAGLTLAARRRRQSRTTL